MNSIDEAISILNRGGVVIYPTDTAFGIGCKADNKKAIKRVFEIRKRPLSKPVSILVDSKKMGLGYFENPTVSVKRLMDCYWPGALTIIYTANNKTIDKLVTAGGSTVGIRMPSHKTTHALIKGIKTGLLGPSANLHNGKTPFKRNDLDEELTKQVDHVVNGDCYGNTASTVIDCTKKPFKIIRQGACIIDKKYLT